MKKILNLKTALSAFAIILLVSCSEVLDTEPISEKIVKTGAVIKDANEAEGYMKACYSEFGGEYWQLDYFFNGDAQTDIAYAGADNVQNFQQDEYRIQATNSNVERDFNYLANIVNKSNIIINYVNTVSDLSATRKTEMIGEASLFRALANFHMVQLWGDCPIVTETITSVNNENFEEVYAQLYPTRKPVTEVYDAIIADCLVALTNAPDASNKFKANKGAANALLAKAYATKPNPDWAKVKQYSDAVIGGGYSLMPTYDNLFDNAHDGNSESIWEADGNGDNVWAWGIYMFAGTDWKKFNTPSNALVKAYDDNNDTQRKASSILFDNVTWADAYWGMTNYPFANKMRDWNGNQNFYIFRLADIILLKAEALANTNDVSGAMTLVNQIRTRAGIASVTATTQDDAINKILNERMLELAFEGHRWFDLKRTGKAIAILSQQKDKDGNILPYASNLNQNRLLWPIPQSQRDNNPNLTQNPGY
ncbi:MAG TPA: RagB/SusD family nutrient uptake outer membrane protein [Flavobacterium sp.]|uniref:RagB/SusD family nutrient uptake outer membrane protein n=1 Tax=Flavobacterium sp. TaxID=239 RepID=UPI002DBC8F3E|nr:RagB/SusD family nutrient uptake outer membrane protein [Flavobacterium sp.]HEU4790757.1 RagB/SusD family nutrient uptake outer membrane protein [Flavobacterium sp.]